jgi:hypothetical protein
MDEQWWSSLPFTHKNGDMTQIELTFYFLVIFFYNNFTGKSHGHMRRGGHELPKVSQRLVIPDPFTPCGRATAETA